MRWPGWVTREPGTLWGGTRHAVGWSDLFRNWICQCRDYQVIDLEILTYSGNPWGPAENRQELNIKNELSGASAAQSLQDYSREWCKPGSIANRQPSAGSQRGGQIPSNIMQRALIMCSGWNALGCKEIAGLIPFPRKSENLVGIPPVALYYPNWTNGGVL